MADANVPIKFEIYKGDQLVREEVLAQSPIKIGKLASSDLRLDDETVSRMHGVIEATGPDDIHVVDLGSTRGTTVNGERITKARLQSGRRDHVRRLPRHRHVRRRRCGAGDAGRRRLRGVARPAGGFAPAADGLRAPAAAAVRAAAASSRTPPQPQQSYARRRPSRARRAPAPRSRSTTARARWRSRPSSAASSPAPATCSTRKGRTRTARARRCCTPASAVAVAGDRHVRRHGDRRRRREGPRTSSGRRPARSRRPSSGRTARRSAPRIVFGGLARRRRRCRTWASSAAARPARTS